MGPAQGTAKIDIDPPLFQATEDSSRLSLESVLPNRTDAIGRRSNRPQNLHLVTPDQFSPAFAYVLGAFLATVRANEHIRPRCTFSHVELGVIDRLAKALHESVGLETFSSTYETSQGTRGRLHVGTSALVTHISEATKGFSTVPWQHILTSEERRAFLTGFFDFAGSIFEPKHRLSATKTANETLVQEVAIVLAREGVYARCTPQPLPSLIVDASAELAKLHSLNILKTEKLSTALNRLVDQDIRGQRTTIEDYETTMEVARRMPGFPSVLPYRVIQAAVKAGVPANHIQLDSVQSWIKGEKPPVVLRREQLMRYEAELLPDKTLEMIGRAIIERARKESLHPFVVIKAIAEWSGGYRELSRAANIKPTRASSIIRRDTLPFSDEYKAILNSVGLELDSEIADAFTPPTIHSVRAQLRKAEERAILDNYASILLAAKNAFAKGEKPMEVVKARIEGIKGRAARMAR